MNRGEVRPGAIRGRASRTTLPSALIYSLAFFAALAARAFARFATSAALGAGDSFRFAFFAAGAAFFATVCAFEAYRS